MNLKNVVKNQNYHNVGTAVLPHEFIHQWVAKYCVPYLIIFMLGVYSVYTILIWPLNTIIQAVVLQQRQEYLQYIDVFFVLFQLSWKASSDVWCSLLLSCLVKISNLVVSNGSIIDRTQVVLFTIGTCTVNSIKFNVTDLSTVNCAGFSHMHRCLVDHDHQSF